MIASFAFIVATCFFLIWLPYDNTTLRMCEESDYGLKPDGSLVQPAETVCNSEEVMNFPESVYVVIAFQRLIIALFILKNFCMCITPVITHALRWKWPFLCKFKDVCGNFNFIDFILILPVQIFANIVLSNFDEDT